MFILWFSHFNPNSIETSTQQWAYKFILLWVFHNLMLFKNGNDSAKNKHLALNVDEKMIISHFCIQHNALFTLFNESLTPFVFFTLPFHSSFQLFIFFLLSHVEELITCISFISLLVFANFHVILFFFCFSVFLFYALAFTQMFSYYSNHNDHEKRFT